MGIGALELLLLLVEQIDPSGLNIHDLQHLRQGVLEDLLELHGGAQGLGDEVHRGEVLILPQQPPFQCHLFCHVAQQGNGGSGTLLDEMEVALKDLDTRRSVHVEPAEKALGIFLSEAFEVLPAILVEEFEYLSAQDLPGLHLHDGVERGVAEGDHPVAHDDDGIGSVLDDLAVPPFTRQAAAHKITDEDVDRVELVADDVDEARGPYPRRAQGFHDHGKRLVCIDEPLEVVLQPFVHENLVDDLIERLPHHGRHRGPEVGLEQRVDVDHGPASIKGAGKRGQLEDVLSLFTLFIVTSGEDVRSPGSSTCRP